MPYLADGTWASSYYSRYASPYWSSYYSPSYPSYDPYWRASAYDRVDPYYYPSSRYVSPYWRSPSRYYDPLPYSYAGYSSYSAYLDAKYARPLPALAPVSTVTYSSPLKTEVVTESPGKREVTTYDYSPSTAYTYASPVRTTYLDYDYPRYSPYYSPRYSRSYVSPYTGSLIMY